MARNQTAWVATALFIVITLTSGSSGQEAAPERLLKVRNGDPKAMSATEKQTVGNIVRPQQLGSGTFRVKQDNEYRAWVSVVEQGGVVTHERWIFDKDFEVIHGDNSLVYERVAGVTYFGNFLMFKLWIENDRGSSKYDNEGLKPVGDKHTKSYHDITDGTE